MKTISNRPFGVRDQVGYFFGDAGGSFVNMFVDAYFLVFCTYVLGISSYYMGTLFLIARIWDAFNDPMIGSIPDRHLLGKSGDRFKPYIRLMMIPLALAGMMCFVNVSSWTSLWKHAWISVSYIAVGMCYTGTSMPYGSLVSVISEDAVERAKLSRARAFGGGIVAGLLAFVPQFLYKENNPVAGAFFLVAFVFGLFSILCYCVMLSNSVERVHYEVKAEEYHYSEVLKQVLKNRPLIGTMIAAVGFLFYNTGFNQLASYLFKEYYHNTGLITVAALITMPLMIVLFPFVPKLVRAWGKKNSILYPTLIGCVLSAILFLVPIANPYVFMILLTLAVVGPMIYALNCWAIVGDCIDYHEYRTGVRADGSIYSIYTFARKIGSALASAFASYSLGFIGFISGVDSQTAEVAGRIRYLVSFVPLASCVLIAVGLGLVYNLDQKESTRINELLREKHMNEREQ